VELERKHSNCQVWIAITQESNIVAAKLNLHYLEGQIYMMKSTEKRTWEVVITHDKEGASTSKRRMTIAEEVASKKYCNRGALTMEKSCPATVDDTMAFEEA
jgi:hypothetical protein